MAIKSINPVKLVAYEKRRRPAVEPLSSEFDALDQNLRAYSKLKMLTEIISKYMSCAPYCSRTDCTDSRQMPRRERMISVAKNQPAVWRRPARSVTPVLKVTPMLTVTPVLALTPVLQKTITVRQEYF